MMESIYNMADKFFLLKKRLREPDLKEILNHSDRSIIAKIKSYQIENEKAIEAPKTGKAIFINTTRPIKPETSNIEPSLIEAFTHSPSTSSINRKNQKKQKPRKTNTTLQLPPDNLLNFAFDKNPLKSSITPIIKPSINATINDKGKEKEKNSTKEKTVEEIKEKVQLNYNEEEEDILMKDIYNYNEDLTPPVEDDENPCSNSNNNNNKDKEDDDLNDIYNDDSGIFENKKIWNDDEDDSPEIGSFNSEEHYKNNMTNEILIKNTNDKNQAHADQSLNKFVRYRHKVSQVNDSQNELTMKGKADEVEHIRPLLNHNHNNTNNNEDIEMNDHDNEQEGKAIVRDNKVIISLKDLGSFDLNKKSFSNDNDNYEEEEDNNDIKIEEDDEKDNDNALQKPLEKDNKNTTPIAIATGSNNNNTHDNTHENKYNEHKRPNVNQANISKGIIINKSSQLKSSTIKKNTKIIEDDDEKDYAYDNTTYHPTTGQKNNNEINTNSNNNQVVTMEGTQLKFNLNMNFMSPNTVHSIKGREHDKEKNCIKDKEKSKDKLQESLKLKDRNHSNPHLTSSPNLKKNERKISTTSSKQPTKIIKNHYNTSLSKPSGNNSNNNQVKNNHINPVKSTKISSNNTTINTSSSINPNQKSINNNTSTTTITNSNQLPPKTLNSIQLILSNNNINTTPANNIVIKKKEHDIVCLSTLDSLYEKLHNKLTLQSNQNSSSSSQIKEVFEETTKVIIQLGKEDSSKRIKLITEKTMKLLINLFNLLLNEKQRDSYINDVQHILETMHTFQHKTKVNYGSKIPQWFKLHKIALKFALSLFRIKTYTSVQLKEIINQSKTENKNSNMNLIKFAKSYKSYNNAIVKLNEIIDKAKVNSHDDSRWKRLVEDIDEYLRINPNISRHSKCFKICRKIIEFIVFYISYEKIKE